MDANHVWVKDERERERKTGSDRGYCDGQSDELQTGGVAEAGFCTGRLADLLS